MSGARAGQKNSALFLLLYGHFVTQRGRLTDFTHMFMERKSTDMWYLQLLAIADRRHSHYFVCENVDQFVFIKNLRIGTRGLYSLEFCVLA